MTAVAIARNADLEALYAARPAFRRLVETHGGRPVGEYESAAISGGPTEPVRLAVAELFARCAGPVEVALPQNAVISTGMHTGLLGSEPALANLFYSLASAPAGSVVSLSNSSVTLTNEHGPELLRLPSAVGLVDIHLFPKKQRKQPVAAVPALPHDELLAAMVRQAEKRIGHGAVGKDTLLTDAVTRVERAWPTREHVFLTEQLADFNTAIAVDLLGGRVAASTRWVAQELLLAEYFERPSPELTASPLARLLLDPAGYAELARVLEGSADFSNDDESSKTAFFWLMSGGSRGRRSPLRVRDGAMVSAAGERFELTRDSLAVLLRNRILVPSAVTKFLLLHLAWGFPVAGGHNQFQYLEELGDRIETAGLLARRPDHVFRPTRPFSLPGLPAPGSPFELLARPDEAQERAAQYVAAIGGVPLVEVVAAYAPHALAAIGAPKVDAEPVEER